MKYLSWSGRVGISLIWVLLAASCADDAVDSGTPVPDAGESDVASRSDGAAASADTASEDVVELSEDTPSDDIDESSAPVCPPGLRGCLDGALYVCADDGLSFEQTACEEGTVCSDGDCVSCGTNADCGDGQTCEGGECVVPALNIVTTALPTAIVGVPYLSQVIAVGGVAPYTWSPVDVQSWPIGVAVGADGQFGGVPQSAGVWELEFQVEDAEGASTSVVLTFEVNDVGLSITTPSVLPGALEGEPYSLSFEADGGQAPYFFGALTALPDGLQLSPDGGLFGTTAVAGDYSFDVKVFDNGSPTLSSQKTFELSVGVAPLEIIGENAINLFVAELFPLSLIVVADGFPVPYNAQLSAKGGKKPYTWTEEPLPGFVQNLLPNSGIPDGLTLNADGSITGGVSDPSLVVSVEIPFTGINISGFFFSARVTDAQDPAESETALYLIPTVPLGGN